jgi:hypothetical protein
LGLDANGRPRIGRLIAHRATAGKSSLTVQFVDGHFVESYYPTIENTFSKIIRYKGQDYATEIIDTAGQVRCLFLATPPHIASPSSPHPRHMQQPQQQPAFDV